MKLYWQGKFPRNPYITKIAFVLGSQMLEECLMSWRWCDPAGGCSESWLASVTWCGLGGGASSTRWGSRAVPPGLQHRKGCPCGLRSAKVSLLGSSEMVAVVRKSF